MKKPGKVFRSFPIYREGCDTEVARPPDNEFSQPKSAM
jgi:hypothetical protein